MNFYSNHNTNVFTYSLVKINRKRKSSTLTVDVAGTWVGTCKQTSSPLLSTCTTVLIPANNQKLILCRVAMPTHTKTSTLHHLCTMEDTSTIPVPLFIVSLVLTGVAFCCCSSCCVEGEVFLWRLEVSEAAVWGGIIGTPPEWVVGIVLSGGDWGGVVMPGTSSHVCKGEFPSNAWLVKSGYKLQVLVVHCNMQYLWSINLD